MKLSPKLPFTACSLQHCHRRGILHQLKSLCIFDRAQEWLDAANALQKQMWEDAPLDKRRMKEEYLIRTQSLSFMRTKTELNIISSAVDGSRNPFGDSKNNE
ncbi:hypothetical protein C5167_037985 [Papaver somniferum]|uniref:Uncharacterized protein n=1 Tax=Papaver somniferum TaxID=3469 RepID=A0A4Y7IAH2_PAPSO|nr:hypothetical protein C5167_037985 [Papaver somniferum]